MSKPKIVVVGSSNTDMVVKSRRIPAPGETVTGGSFVQAPGGKGANQAVAAARLGADVTFVARLGIDAFGDQAVEGYERDGIRTDLVIRDPQNHTGVALILVDERGENLISVASGANHALCAADIDRAAKRIGEAKVLILQLETPMDAVIRAAEIANRAGVYVILDPAPAPDSALPMELLKNVTCIKPNESEAERLTDQPVRDAASAREVAAKLLAMGPRAAIVTLGSKGSVVADATGQAELPTSAVDAVDTTAAGDAFTGALGLGIASGLSLHDAVALASMAGALSATRMGAQPSLPTRAELDAFGRDRGIAIKWSA